MPLFRIGSYCNDKGSNSVRLIAGFWCLAAAVLIPAYSGQLISFVTSPIEKAVIQSVYDIPNVPGLKVAVDRGKGIDGLFRQMVLTLMKLNTFKV